MDDTPLNTRVSRTPPVDQLPSLGGNPGSREPGLASRPGPAGFEPGRELPDVWGGKRIALTPLGGLLRAIKWDMRGRTGPDNLLDWLLANNRHPEYRGRAAALQFIIRQDESRTDLLEEAQTLFALGVGAMTDNGDKANQERCVREAGELNLRISKALASIGSGAGDVRLRELLIETQDTIRDVANGGEQRFGDLWRKIDAALSSDTEIGR